MSNVRFSITAANDTFPEEARYRRIDNGDGGGKGGGMDTVDAKIAASEARTDTKFAQLMGELSTMRAEINGRLDVLGTRVGHVETSTAGMKTTVIVTAIAALGLTVAVMAYGSQWFGLGMDAQQVADRAAQTSMQNLQPQVDALNVKMDTLIRGLNERMMGSGEMPAPYKPQQPNN
ncbi:hypothetical protein FY152_04305 [Agrobacterium tumefaciens]|nr:hypothetical protein FY152_04305 [Agrobacterium tumefaciens]